MCCFRAVAVLLLLATHAESGAMLYVAQFSLDRISAVFFAVVCAVFLKCLLAISS